MEEVQTSNGMAILFAVLITLGVVMLGGFGLYYFFAPPPEMSLQEAADRRTKEKEAFTESERQAFVEAARTIQCGAGISGALCRLGQGACDTALGSYFCYTEGRDTGD
ncbi:hypothetical protein HY413_02870 [Candidatus Kaiserbacteria bacterium]|nr:hypothetical protein [Candidatus Kaiserbacteria bacterium]